jgi:HAD superfamily hydrolase (TIGR01509 family)
MDLNLEQMKCAILDLDGTLLDSTHVWEKIDVDFLGKRGLTVTQDYMHAIKTHNFTTGSKYVVERFNLDEKPEDIAVEWQEMAQTEYDKNIMLKPYAYEFLCRIKNSGIKLALATSSKHSLFEKCLKRNGIYELFDTFTETHEVSRTKEFPDVYDLAAERAGAGIEECVVFEDILTAVRGAKSGGFFTVAVYDKASENDAEKIKKECDRYIFSYKELL